MINLQLELAGIPGGWEWIIIALVVLLLFGAKRLPELAKGLGQGIREFKGAMEGAKDELKEAQESIEKDVNSDHQSDSK